MRVLAIRGRNLASLAGDFEVDFEAEPLADAGIFAITGPTGAGKSTLLDAVSLALFDEIPRLSAAPSGVRIASDGQDEGITAGDPRLILRHGAGEGFAEVDFATAGGARYRATWKVRRARDLPTGKLQAVQQTFLRLDTGEVLGGKKTETLAAIREVVGLSADQFGRAVLLAQGEFEAFIRAKPDERALLLEKLTGSEIYARLGRKAYEKAQELRRGMDALRTQIDSQNGLDDASRKQAEDDLAEARIAEENAAQHFALLDAGRKWESRAAELAEQLTLATQAKAQAETAVEHAAPRREALARDRKAMALAAKLADRDKANDAIGATQDSIAKGEELLARTTGAEQQAAQNEQAAQNALAEKRKAMQAAAPDLARARELDLRIGDAARRLDEADKVAGDHAKALAGKQQSEGKARKAFDRAQQRWDDHARWLDAHAALAPLTSRQDELLNALATHARDNARLASLSAKAQEAEQGRLTALAKWNDAGEALEVATATHGDAKAALEAIEANLPDPSRLGEITQLRDDLRAFASAVANQQRTSRSAQEVVEALSLARAGHEQALAAASAARDEDAALAAQLPALRARRDEAARSAALAAAAGEQAAQAMREQLVEGEPCPVCGATEHHLSALDAVLGDHLNELRARLSELTSQLDAITARRGEMAGDLKVAEAQAATQAKELARLEPQLASLTAEAERLAAAISSQAAALGLPGSADDLPPALNQRTQQADQDLAALTDAQTQVEKARKAEATARSALDKARDAHSKAQDALTHRNRVADEITSEAKSLTGTIAQTAALIDAALAPLADWRTLADAAAWLTAQLQAWATHDAGRAVASDEVARLGDALNQTASDLSVSQSRAHDSAEAAAKAREDHAALLTQRQGVLDGEPVADVEGRINQAIAAAETALATATQARNNAKEAIVAAQTALTKDRQLLGDQHHSLELARDAFALALKAAHLAEEDVRRVAEVGQAALDAEADALAGLDSTLAEGRAVLAKCQEDLARHEASDAPALGGAELALALAEAEQARAKAAAHCNEIALRLRMDDQVRAQTEDLRDRLSRAEAAADVWLRLNDLIGDATGNKFRKFAQGLTLDRLLEHANARLVDLKPRFTLERAPGGDMLIQVIDNDMAGDVRGLHNLSGGERFLVSLSLALGLAEMSTNKGVRIESLFIDEGFGALDPKSLGDAIAVLEHLHATGRRVGVISHVEDLKERIPVKIEVTPAAPGRSTIAVMVD